MAQIGLDLEKNLSKWLMNCDLWTCRQRLTELSERMFRWKLEKLHVAWEFIVKIVICQRNDRAVLFGTKITSAQHCIKKLGFDLHQMNSTFCVIFATRVCLFLIFFRRCCQPSATSQELLMTLNVRLCLQHLTITVTDGDDDCVNFTNYRC